MSTLTLPRCAAPNPSRWPVYFIHNATGDGLAAYSLPFLPERSGFRWATDDEVAGEHITLDLGAVAQLLFLADVDPEHIDDVHAIEAVDHALIDCGCDMTACAAEVGAELADHPDTARGRFEHCVARAARLLEAEA